MGDREQLFGEYVAARWPALRRTAYLLTGDVSRAEDLVQTALVRTLGRVRAIRDPQALDAYVRRALVTQNINDSRRSWRREVPQELPDAPAEEPVGYEEVDVVIAALRDLPVRQRTAVVLRHYADLSEQDTATAMGCPVGTVKTLTARGLAALRARLVEEVRDDG